VVPGIFAISCFDSNNSHSNSLFIGIQKQDPPEEIKLSLEFQEIFHGCKKKFDIIRSIYDADGKEIKTEDASVTIDIPPRTKFGKKFVFEKLGDQRPGTIPADIIFIIEQDKKDLENRKKKRTNNSQQQENRNNVRQYQNNNQNTQMGNNNQNANSTNYSNAPNRQWNSRSNNPMNNSQQNTNPTNYRNTQNRQRGNTRNVNQNGRASQQQNANQNPRRPINNRNTNPRNANQPNQPQNSNERTQGGAGKRFPHKQNPKGRNVSQSSQPHFIGTQTYFNSHPTSNTLHSNQEEAFPVENKNENSKADTSNETESNSDDQSSVVNNVYQVPTNNPFFTNESESKTSSNEKIIDEFDYFINMESSKAKTNSNPIRPPLTSSSSSINGHGAPSMAYTENMAYLSKVNNARLNNQRAIKPNNKTDTCTIS